jgi:DNA polymerase-1
LNKDRGLQDETIRIGNLGWIPEDLYMERSDWGLPEKLKEDGTPSKLWVPAGLVIPCHHDGSIQRLKVRRDNPEDGIRYYMIPGSSSIPMILGNNEVYVIVESKLDALLLHQEAWDLVGVIALGSADMKPDKGIFDLLRHAKKILVSLDSDEAGARASWKWWMANFPNAARWPIIYGKDPTEAYLKGLNLRDWIQAGIGYERKEKLQEESKTVSPSPPPANNMTSIEDIRKLSTTPILAIRVDTESPSTKGIISICSPDEDLAVIINLDSEETAAALRELLESPVRKVAYDAIKTIVFLHDQHLEVKGNICDVMLADQVMRAGLDNEKRTFSDVAVEDLGYTARLSEDHDPIDRMKIESAQLLKLREAILPKLHDNNLLNTAILEFSCVPATAAMEMNGISVNRDQLLEMQDTFSSMKETLKTKLHKELGEINLNSPKQLIEALKGKGINISNTSKATLLSMSTEHPFLLDLVSYRKLSTSLSSVNNIIHNINPATGKVHPTYNQIGAPTGRFSCSEPNIQGISKAKDFRSCFVAADGHKLIIADYSQVELRIAAEISGDQRMINAYQKGEDLHKLTASLVAGKSIADITKEERNAAKAVNFGLIYAMGAKTLMEYASENYDVIMTEQQAVAFRSKFFSAYQGIAKWHQSVHPKIIRETRTLGGRRRLWTDTPKITELLNSPVQGTSADITKKALCLLHERLQGSGIKIIGCIHDEIILEAPIAETETAAQILRNSMIEAGQCYLKNVPILVDVSVADNWYEK